MSEALAWWLLLQLLGALAFPLAYLFFAGLEDRGYSLAKIVGLLLVGYGVWLGGSLDLWPYTRGSIIFGLAILAVAALAIVGYRRAELAEFWRRRWPYIVLVEALFALAFFLAAWLRSYVPEIAATEKPMEAAILSGLARDSSIPPQDVWLSGHEVNYYYFGYLMIASQMKLLGLAVDIGFNLGLSTIVALGALAGFGLAYNLVAARRGRDAPTGGWGPAWGAAAGLAAVILLFVYSNYVGVLELLAAHGFDSDAVYGFFDIQGLDGPRASDHWYPSEFWWWWRSSRVVPGTITEFPFFSFLLGDLHPHVLAIPFLLLAVAVGWNLFAQPEEALHWRQAARWLMMAVLIGAIGFIHTINLPVVLALLVAVYGLRQYQRRQSVNREFALSTALFAAILAVGALLVYLPFYLNYDTPSSGILLTKGPDTRPVHLFLQWGLFLLLVTGLAVYAISRHPQGWRFTQGQTAIALAVSLAPVVVWAVLRPGLASGPSPSAGASAWLTVIWLAGTLALLLLALLRPAIPGRQGQSDGSVSFALAMAAVALFVLLGTEFFFVKDVFNSRLNTVFKGWYLAWLLLGSAAAFSAYVFIREWRPRLDWGKAFHRFVLGSAALLLLAGLVYPLTSTYNRTDDFDNPTTLDGLAFLERSRPDEYAALHWLMDNVSGTPVILEAVGDSYSESARVSAYTGLPTVLGWPFHELQWRDSYEPQGTRRQDVDTAYSTTNAALAQAILDRYGVRYVYVGPLERSRYEAPSLEKFASFMDVAFKNQGVTIYRR